MKFKVKVDCDYLMGHLRYGHYEGEVDVENEEELKELIENEEIIDYLDIVVDDYEIEDAPVDYGSLKYKKVED
jgi:hypothetical protein